MPQALAPLLSLMDGTHDLAALYTTLRDELGEEIEFSWLNKFVGELDELLLLDSPSFQEREAAAQARFAAERVRPAAFAGRSYPGKPVELRNYLTELRFKGETLLGNGPDREFLPGQVRGIVVPHIDFMRGGPEEALAYLPLVENVVATDRSFDTLVVFGIAHAGVRYPFCAATKDYATPLGTAVCDRDFLSDLQSRLGPRLTREQMVHANDHSDEFVAVFTQYYPELATSQIVPILCGGFWQPLRLGYSPLLDPDVSLFVEVLRQVTAEHEARGKKIGFIASVDGAHVGSNFGDDTPLDPLRLKEIEFSDRDWCAAIAAGDAEGLHAHFARDENRFNVDAHPAVYTLLAAFPSWRGQLLAYNQAYNAAENSVVSFASLTLFEPV